MLGPVSAPTNLYQPVQETRPQAEIRTSEKIQPTVGLEPYSTSAAGTISGNLNMMLLSAPERMSQNLVVLTEVLAVALKMKQEPGESLTTFAARLIEAIAALAPAEQQKLKAMLSDAFAGLQLRTLLQALRNPQGPEAATLAIYLELYRQKDRDPGARAVISSYRQNGGMPLAQAGEPRSVEPRPSPPAPGRPLQVLAASSPRAGPPVAALPSRTSGAIAYPSATALPAEEDLSYGAATPNAPDASDAADSANLQALRQMRERLAKAADPTLVGSQTPAGQADVEAAGAVLDAAGPDAPPSTERSKSALSETSGREPELATMAEGLDPDAEVVAALPDVRPSTPASTATLLQELAETQLIRTLLALYGADGEPDVVDRALDALTPATPSEMEADNEPSHNGMLVASTVEEPDLPAPDRPLHFEERLALTASNLPSDHRDAPRVPASGDGLPLAFVNYVIDSDDESPSRSEARRQTRDDEGSGEAAEEERPRDEEAADDATEEEPESMAQGPVASDGDGPADIDPAPPSMDVVEPAALPLPEVDPAQALYLRLSDFA